MGERESRKRIAAHFALLPDGVAANPLVTVDTAARRILAVERYDPATLDSLAGVEFHPGMLVPALVNAHTHLELSALKGSVPQGCGFAGFAAAMAAVRNNFTREQRMQAALRADREMFDAGIAAAGDIANDDSVFAVKQEGLVRYKTFCEVFGINTPNYHRMAQLAAQNPARCSLTPHSLYSLNDGLLKQLCREGEGVLSVHFMESPDESLLFEGRGSLREWFARQGFRADFLHYDSPAQRLTACVPPDRSVMLVHCCCVTQKDIDLIMNHFRAPVYWCLCPESNRYISGLQPDVELLRRNRLAICLGTDSLASNTSLTMTAELRSFPDVPADEVLRWATANGAAALGLDDGTGLLREGSQCGLAVVSGIDFAAMRLTSKTEIRRLV